MKSAPILIIDKVGLIGEPLCLKLSKEFSIVFVSKKTWESEAENRNIIHTPFSRKFPTIPDNKYSHIVVVDDEETASEFLPKIIEKARGINADFILALGLFPKVEHKINKVLSTYSASKIVLYGDIFDNKLIYGNGIFKSTINRLIHQAQKFNRMQVIGDGLREIYPVFISDVVEGLIDIVFGFHKSNSLFYLFPKHPPTELSLAHMIQKANPEIGIDFIRSDPRRVVVSHPLHGKYLLEDKYPLAKKIRNIDIKKNPPAPIESGPTGGKIEDYKNLQGRFSNAKRFPVFIIWILIFLILSPFVFALIFSFLGLNTLYFAKTQINRGNLSDVRSSLHLAKTFFYIGKKASDVLYFQGKIVGIENNLKRLLEDIDLGHRISEGALQAFNSEIYFSRIFTGKSKNPIGDFEKGKNYLKNSIIELEKIKAEGKVPAPILQKLGIINPLIKFLSSASDILPGVFGMEGPRAYLILFQNNMELRPGGGFIESYGILKLNMGKITQFSIHDVYDADEQLRGHVEPPFALRRYLPSEHWYMRDSNFDVDFVKSALSSSNFLSIETGQEVSGVIGIDLSFVKSILYAIGPVYVADYKEAVDENNLYILTQAHSEKDFLRSLYKAIVKKISKERVLYLLLAQAISDSILQKHLLFGLNNDSQNIFIVNGWSSSLWDERRRDEKSVNDFLGINEANLGVNKVNYFIKRQVSQKVTIGTDGNISEELAIDYKNESTAEQGGDYKNYLRIILPKDTVLSEIAVNDVIQVMIDAVTDPLIYEEKNFKAPQGLEIEKVSENNKTIFGFIVKIPVGELVKVRLKYMLPESVSGLDIFSYNLKLFKQPGVDSIPYSFSLTYPNSLGVIEGKTSYSKSIVQDENLIVDFAKKQ